jgi:peptidoglycan/LPS O-acetylase OafA/YrhL
MQRMAVMEQEAAPTGVVRRAGSYPALDGLRAIAVTCVVLTHVGFQTGQSFKGSFGALLNRLEAGVPIFFLISGFLLYSPFVHAQLQGEAKPRVRTYLRNRALRILPAYWVLLAVVFLFEDQRYASTGEVLRQVFLLQTYSPRHVLPDLNQTWSLCVEGAFYIALPLLALLARRGRDPLRAHVILLGGMVAVSTSFIIASQGFHWPHYGIETVILPSFLDWFALGMGVALLRAWHDLTGRARWLDQIGDAGLTCYGIAALVSPTGGQLLVKHLLYGVMAAFLLIPAVFGTDDRSVVRRALEARPLRWVGRVSYGVFLFHLVVLTQALPLLGIKLFTGHFVEVLVVTYGGSLLAAAISLRLVEQPALRLKRRWATSGR